MSQLEDWCRCHGAAAVGVANQLAPILQVSKLLQMKKSHLSDVDSICGVCTELNALQVMRGHCGVQSHSVVYAVGAEDPHHVYSL